jgi:hypothetical protein
VISSTQNCRQHRNAGSTRISFFIRNHKYYLKNKVEVMDKENKKCKKSEGV